eukprot:1393169-Rhodomonas_salina.1
MKSHILPAATHEGSRVTEESRATHEESHSPRLSRSLSRPLPQVSVTYELLGSFLEKDGVRYTSKLDFNGQTALNDPGTATVHTEVLDLPVSWHRMQVQSRPYRLRTRPPIAYGTSQPGHATIRGRAR